MLEEYIRQQLSDLEEDADQLTEQLKKLNEQEKSAEEILNSLTEHEDIGMEIFSPRSNESELKAKIEEQTDHITWLVRTLLTIAEIFKFVVKRKSLLRMQIVLSLLIMKIIKIKYELKKI